MDILGIIGIILGIATIIFFIVKKFNIIVAAPIATFVVLLFNDTPLVSTLFGKENSYMTSLAGFIASNFAIFLLGSILAKYMDKSGATVSIANKILSLVGTKNPYNALVALFIISAILTYGGINVFVIIFALIPMSKPIFKELNLSWKLVTIPIFDGTSTFTMTMLPGAPSLHNVVPSNALGTKLTAAPVIGIATSIAAVIFILIFMKISLNRSLKKNETFQVAEEKMESSEEMEREIPSFMISLLPIVTLLAIILIFSSVENIIIIALVVAILLSAILFRKHIEKQKDVLNQGANESLSSTITTGSTIAFGSIATSVPAFKGVYEKAESAGIKMVETLKEVAEQADEAIISMVRDYAQNVDIIFHDGLLSAKPQNKTIIVMSTLDPHTMNELGEKVESESDLKLISAAVSGGRSGAEAGTLSIMTAGPRDIVDACRPYFDAMGSHTFYYGEQPGNSQVAKLVNNMVLGITMNAVAEGLKLGNHYNLPEDEILNLMKVSTGDSWVVQNWSEVSQWTAETALSVLLKDLIATYNLGIKHNIPMPFNALSSTHLFHSMEKEKPDE